MNLERSSIFREPSTVIVLLQNVNNKWIVIEIETIKLNVPNQKNIEISYDGDTSPVTIPGFRKI